MTTKYVHETAAGSAIQAWVILRDGKHVATIRAHCGRGSTLINVYHLDGITEFQSKRAGPFFPPL